MGTSTGLDIKISLKSYNILYKIKISEYVIDIKIGFMKRMGTDLSLIWLISS